MPKGFGPYIIQTTGRRVLPRDLADVAVNDRSAYKSPNAQTEQVMAQGRQAAFNRWLSQVSYMLDEWEMELMGHAAPLSTFETIAAFKDVLSRDQRQTS